MTASSDEVICRVPRVVLGKNSSPTAAHASRNGRLKWVPGAWG
jgi:hypothetical protein